MNKQKDGQTTEASRRRKERITKSQRERLGLVSSQGPVNGTEQIRASSENRTGGNTTRQGRQGETSDGKILERLEFIENAYLSYVDGHQERLEARLLESREKKEVFKQAVQELKQEIYELISEETIEEPE